MRKTCLLVFMLMVPCLAAFAGQQDQSSAAVSSGGQPPAASAATPAQPIAATNTAARLHVYRQHRYAGSALAPSIAVDGKPVARVGNGRRVTIKLTPGSHTISSDDKSSSIAIDAKPGQDYYIRVDEETGFWKGHGRLTLVMAEQGSAEYKLQKPIEPDREIVKEMIEDDAEAAPLGKSN
jgi:hypothetical protein